VSLDAVWHQTKLALEAAYRELVRFSVSAVEAAIVVVIAVIVARTFRARTRHALSRWTLSGNVIALIANGVSIGIYIIAGTIVLGIFGANWTALLAFLSVSTVAISLALQDLLKNFVAGVYLLVERPFEIGERIKIGDVMGRVENIEIRTTVLRNPSDERVLVPNATIFSGIITNRSAYRQTCTTVTVSGITHPIETIAPAVRSALAGIDVLRQPPRVAVQSASAEGVNVEVSVLHPLDTDITAVVVGRLRDAFPHASVAVGGS